MATNNITADMVRDLTLELIDKANEITGSSEENLRDAIDAINTTARAQTTLDSTKDAAKNTLVFTAENNQGTGYVTGSNSTATKTVSISADGKTVTASDGTNSISATVDAKYVDTSSGTARAYDILEGEKAWVDGEEVTGRLRSWEMYKYEDKDILPLRVFLDEPIDEGQDPDNYFYFTGYTMDDAIVLSENMFVSEIPKGNFGNATQDCVIEGAYFSSAEGVCARGTMPHLTRAETYITTDADDTNDVLTLTASNNQGAGYTDGGNKTATKRVTLSVSGATVTATDDSSTPVKVSKSVAIAERAPTTLTSAKSNNTLVFTARNNQGTGYVEGSNSTATKTVSISASGKTVTATDETNSISASVKDGIATTPATTITATNTITFDEDSGLITATASGSKSISPTVTEGYVKSGTAGTVSVTGTNTLQLTKVGVSIPDVTTLADDEEGEIYISALTNQPSGYCKGGKSGVVGKYIKLKIEGDTAIMYEAGNPSQEVRRKVGASINTCNITINIVDNVGLLGVTATQFANGAVTTFKENKSSGKFEIPNVVCDSIITIVCNGWFSIGAWTNASQVGSTSLTLIAPNTTGDYSANIIAYDD